METQLAGRLVDDYEHGRLSRRQLVTRLMGLGAALATMEGSVLGQQGGQGGQAATQQEGQGSAQTEQAAARQGAQPTFSATGLDHIALDVTDVARSREFYMKHLGLRVIRGTGDDSSFLGAERDFFLTLFRGEQPGLNHYCYAIPNYNPDDAVQRLTAAGIQPRRTGGRVYFPDPDGITVQVA